MSHHVNHVHIKQLLRFILLEGAFGDAVGGHCSRTCHAIGGGLADMRRRRGSCAACRARLAKTGGQARNTQLAAPALPKHVAFLQPSACSDAVASQPAYSKPAPPSQLPTNVLDCSAASANLARPVMELPLHRLSRLRSGGSNMARRQSQHL